MKIIHEERSINNKNLFYIKKNIIKWLRNKRVPFLKLTINYLEKILVLK